MKMEGSQDNEYTSSSYINWDAVDMGTDEIDDAFHTMYFGIIDKADREKRKRRDQKSNTGPPQSRVRTEEPGFIFNPPSEETPTFPSEPPHDIPPVWNVKDIHHPTNKQRIHREQGNSEYHRKLNEHRAEHEAKHGQKAQDDAIRAKQEKFINDHPKTQIQCPSYITSSKEKRYVISVGVNEISTVFERDPRPVKAGHWFFVDGAQYKEWFPDWPRFPHRHKTHQNHSKTESLPRGNNSSAFVDKIVDRIFHDGNTQKHSKKKGNTHIGVHSTTVHKDKDYEKLYKHTACEIVTTYPVEEVYNRQYRIVESSKYDAMDAARFFTKMLGKCTRGTYLVKRRTETYENMYGLGKRDKHWDKYLMALKKPTENSVQVALIEVTSKITCFITFTSTPVEAAFGHRQPVTTRVANVPDPVPKKSEIIISCEKARTTPVNPTHTPTTTPASQVPDAMQT